MPVSKKQILANLRNAQKSTGPRSPLRKFRSSRNALKHGLYYQFNLDRALQFPSPKNKARYLSSFLNELFCVYSGNKSKTHSDLSCHIESPRCPTTAHKSKNKAISDNPDRSVQSVSRQQLKGKKPQARRA